ncbi:MAG: DUF4325 domain-containing protein [Actinobacteria bacterium]|nr:DUF4325 domain-containing protein [Actinomycetota bacterium]
MSKSKRPNASRKGNGRKSVKQTIEELLDRTGGVSSGEVARAAGITRQAAHYHLSRMTAAGLLSSTGARRGTRYARATLFSRSYRLAGLSEDSAWSDVAPELTNLEIDSNAISIQKYVFTEMLNNAIDHSESASAEVSLWAASPSPVRFQISDYGVGVFANVARHLRLESPFDAIQELTKGKVTTMPERHLGEGIFFSSKVVDVFWLESNGLRWTVDNLRADHAVGEVPKSPGTLVGWELMLQPSRTLADVFEAFTHPESLAFSRTMTQVKLLETAAGFVSRSEAKRIGRGLDRFDDVTLDFQGVTEIGQGFVDELFRVWQRDNPSTRLRVINASPVVAKMIERGLAGEAGQT